jgi:hypothetical protein
MEGLYKYFPKDSAWGLKIAWVVEHGSSLSFSSSFSLILICLNPFFPCEFHTAPNAHTTEKLKLAFMEEVRQLGPKAFKAGQDLFQAMKKVK